MATATAEALEIQFIAIEKLEPHPKNPHGELKKDDPAILDLKAKIGAVGQKVPCLVRPKGKGYELVLGHRRSFVRALLGFNDVPCIVGQLTDDMADVLVVQENDSHEPPNAFLEAEVVSDLLARPGWTLESVAQHLGRGKRWVALRSNLRNLHPKIRDLIAKKKIDWPLDWLEDVARLTPESQAQLVNPGGDTYRQRLEDVGDRRSLDHLLGEKFHILGKATWDLEDATLCPKAGSCVACPRTSLRAPGLFDDADVDAADPKALKNAVCRDAICWQAKADAVTKAKIVELKAKEPKAELLKSYHTHVPAGLKAKEKGYGTQEVKKDSKGAKPAIFLDDEKGPRLTYVKERTYSSAPKPDPTKKPGKDEDPKKALAKSKREIAARREELFYSKVAGAISDRKKPPAHEIVLGLVTAFGVSESWEVEDLAGTKKSFDLAAKLPAWDAEVWDRLKDSIERPLDSLKGEERDAFVEWITAILEIDQEKLHDETLKDIPDPKWWPKDDAAAVKGSNKPRKKLLDGPAGELQKIGLLSGAGVEEGICRGCKCTHDRACPGGCTWVEKPNRSQETIDRGRLLPMGLCSSCAGAQPKGKAKKGKA